MDLRKDIFFPLILFFFQEKVSIKESAKTSTTIMTFMALSKFVKFVELLKSELCKNSIILNRRNEGLSAGQDGL